MQYKIIKGRNYLLACSFAAPSMALLDVLVNRGCHPVVLFIDYQQAPSHDEDLIGIKEYCAEKGLVIEVFDALEVGAKENENYAQWARRVRYTFFEEMYAKYDAAALFVAHTQDDLLETYLRQKGAGEKVERYGLNEINTYSGMIVVRPLLPYTYDDVIEYLQEHSVPYSRAMTEFERSRTHSDIRRTVIDNMDEIERGRLMDEIRSANNEKLTYFNSIAEQAEGLYSLNIREIIALDEDEFTEALIAFTNKGEEDIVLTPRKLSSIRKMCLNGELFDSMALGKKTYLIKEYDTLTLTDDKNAIPYCYTIEGPGPLKTKEFEIDLSEGAEEFGIKEGDYPLTIRSVIPSDQTIVHDRLQFVKTLYGEWKMPESEYPRWPLIVANDGRILYIPPYGGQLPSRLKIRPARKG